MTQEFQSRIIELTDSVLSESITTDALIRLMTDLNKQSPPKEIIHLFLELAHLPGVAKIISAAGLTDVWLKQICSFIIKSQYHHIRFFHSIKFYNTLLKYHCQNVFKQKMKKCISFLIS